MRKLWLILAIVVLPTAILLLNQRTESNEPTYDGRPLSYWLMDLEDKHHQERYDGHTMAFWMSTNPDPNASQWDNTNAEANAAETAIRAIGTNALPALIDRIRSRPGRAAQAAQSVAKKIGVPIRSVQEAERRTDEAISAFGFLGSNASPAIGTLSNMVCNPNNRRLASASTQALMHLGGPGVKTLTSILAEPSARWRTIVAYNIVDCRPQDVEIAIAALASLTNDPNKDLREACAANLQLLNRRNRKNR